MSPFAPRKLRIFPGAKGDNKKITTSERKATLDANPYSTLLLHSTLLHSRTGGPIPIYQPPRFARVIILQHWRNSVLANIVEAR